MDQELQTQLDNIIASFVGSDGKPLPLNQAKLTLLPEALAALIEERFFSMPISKRDTYFRKLAFSIHPDRLKRTHLKASKKQLIQPETAKIINQLLERSGDNCEQQALLSLVSNIYKNFPTVDNFCKKIEILLNEPFCLYTTEQSGKDYLLPDNQLIFLYLSPHHCFAGTLIEWLRIQLTRYFYIAFNNASDKKAAATALVEKLKEWPSSSNLRKPLELAYSDAWQAEKCPPLPWLAANEALIKYYLIIAEHECKQSFDMLPNTPYYHIKVRDEIDENQQPLSYYTHTVQPYQEYQIKLAIWRMLYLKAYPSPDVCKLRALPASQAAYTFQQYELLRNLFRTNIDEATLAPFRLTAEKISYFNQLLAKDFLYNWLQENTDWSYAQGSEAVICRPWGGKGEEELTRVTEDYTSAYAYKQYNLLLEYLNRHPARLGLNRFNLFIKYFILFLPACWLTGSFITTAYLGFTKAAFSLNTLSTLLLMGPSAFVFLTMIFIVLYCKSQNLLLDLSQLYAEMPISNLSDKFPKWIQQLYAQTIIPLKRIAFNSIVQSHPAHAHNLARLRLFRITAGLVLGLITTINFIGVKINLSILRIFPITLYAAANIWFDWPQILEKIKNMAKFRSKTNNVLPASPRPIPLPLSLVRAREKPLLLIDFPTTKSLPQQSEDNLQPPNRTHSLRGK